MNKIDLHTHTTASDGKLTPSELVAKAADVGIGTLAITDHDTVAGLAEAQEAAKLAGITIVPGVELGADFDSYEVHMLGYFFDPTDPALLGTLAELRDGRLLRARRILDKLQGLGMSIPWERVNEIASGGVVGRPHIAQALVEAGYGTGVDEVFGLYLGHGKPAYVERTQLTPQGCIELVHSAGGVASLAHPTWLKRPEALLPTLVEAGLDGIETYYGSYDLETVNWLARLAAQYNLVPTGGTDYHGFPGLAHADLGSRSLPPECFAQLERRSRDRQQL
ncbi:MAG: PHP domain-containing protein [Chloroflexota bacterium]